MSPVSCVLPVILLAMQKVEGSSPFSRFPRTPPVQARHAPGPGADRWRRCTGAGRLPPDSAARRLAAELPCQHEREAATTPAGR